MDYSNLIFSDIDNVYGYDLNDSKHYINGDLKAVVIVAKSDIDFTLEELAKLDSYGKILLDNMKAIRGSVSGGNYYLIKKCARGFQCRRRSWDSSNYYPDFEEFFGGYINK